MSKKISDVFDVEPVKVETPLAIQPAPTTDVVDHDADFATKNIRDLVTIGNKALEEAYEVAIQSESPRAYEVLSTLLRTVADMNGQIMEIHSKKQQIKSKANITQNGNQPAQVGTSVTNNAIFVGTASELSDMILKRMENK